jgi:phage-related minor tail protein
MLEHAAQPERAGDGAGEVGELAADPLELGVDGRAGTTAGPAAVVPARYSPSA